MSEPPSVVGGKQATSIMATNNMDLPLVTDDKMMNQAPFQDLALEIQRMIFRECWLEIGAVQVTYGGLMVTVRFNGYSGEAKPLPTWLLTNKHILHTALGELFFEAEWRCELLEDPELDFIWHVPQVQLLHISTPTKLEVVLPFNHDVHEFNTARYDPVFKTLGLSFSACRFWRTFNRFLSPHIESVRVELKYTEADLINTCFEGSIRLTQLSLLPLNLKKVELVCKYFPNGNYSYPGFEYIHALAHFHGNLMHEVELLSAERFGSLEDVEISSFLQPQEGHGDLSMLIVQVIKKEIK
ncbi:hypothetical protein BS50DRAFT_589304 [Corynespora cassiicola Philippines]|uniref:Uncharacterized protein n=1 Tax=Corynespora cassiicola Philippines TaxID=1448308 RepID=A0A2T2NHU6_CORCC|nr:hypothetical protein BS50DRAFT_589304 [Corynespora cassiicola Philippines]